jgi:hypothetical protein
MKIVRYSGLLLIISSILFNPFLLDNFTNSGSDPIFNNFQMIYIQVIFLILGILFIERPKWVIREKKILIPILFFLLFIFLAFEFLIIGVLFSLIFLSFIAFFLIKKEIFIKNKKEITLLLYVISIIIIFLEIFARIYLVSSLTLLPSYGGSIVEFSKSGLLQNSEYPDVIYELKSNKTEYFLLKEVKTNSYGIRDKEYPIEKGDSFRIIVIGDSVTFPFGVSIDDAYHSRLEEWYNDKSNISIEVLNFGVGGYSLSNYVGVLENKIEPFSPDHIIIGFLPTNDFIIEDIPSFKEKNKRTNGFFRLWSQKLITNAIYNIKTSRPIKREYNLTKVDFYFSKIRNFSDSYNVTITFVALLREQEKENYGYEFNLLKNMTEKYNFSLIDTSYKFKKIDWEESKIFRSDNHGNELTNELYAEAIFENINISKT